MPHNMQFCNPSYNYGFLIICFIVFYSLPVTLNANNISNTSVIEEVTVTAERRESNQQLVPIAVSSFSTEDLQAQQVNNIGDLQTLVPNLSIHSGDANNAVVYIRGVGQIDSIAFFEPGVGVYLDDVYLGRAQGAFLDVVDVERIEVLRGPQGSLYGRNTVGGAIKYISAKPTDEFSGNTSITAGNYNRRDFKASVSGTLINDTLLGRMTIAQLSHDGYSFNVFDGENDGDQDTDFFRAVLLYDISENLSIQWAADHTFSDPDRSRTPAKQTPINLLIVDPFSFSTSTTSFPADEDPFKVNVDFNTREETKIQGSDINLTWDISSQLVFKSISSYRELDYETQVDLDGTPINAFGIFYYNNQRQISQELQLSFQGEQLSAISGLYYFNEKNRTFDGGVFSNLLLASSGISESSTDSYAIFSQFDYALSDRLTAIFGFRYTKEEKDYQRLVEDFDLTTLAGLTIDPITFAVSYTNPRLLSPQSTDLSVGEGIGVARPVANPDTANFENFSPKLGLKFQITEDAQVYSTVSSGFKSGGFNGRLADGQLDPYEEETLTSIEIGVKSQWFDDRFRCNTAVFYNNYDDLQVSSFESTNNGNAILPVFSNAGKAVIQGAEIELKILATESLIIDMNIGYLDTEYKEFFAGADTTTNTVIDVSDQRELINSPEWDTFLGASYELFIDDIGLLTLTTDISYRSKTYLEINSSENLAQGGYSLVGASILFQTLDEHWQFILGGKNLSDKEYRTHAFDLSAFPGVELGYYNPPRTYSLSAIYSF